jgi:cytochrome c peroxidase
MTGRKTGVLIWLSVLFLICSFVSFEHDTDSQELGKKLFYDPILSIDSTVSCGTCHQSFVAFAHADHALSHGVLGKIGNRNVPGLFNLNERRTWMWDGAVHQLLVQPLAPITGENEMGESIEHILMKLNRSAKYRSIFKAVYQVEEIQIQDVLRALTSFVSSLRSIKSTYDEVIEGKKRFTAQQQRGFDLFQQQCSGCHPAPWFTDQLFHRVGLPVDTTMHDLGRARVTGLEIDEYAFLTPSLRNIGFTAPYGHDGRFKKLSQVLDFYQSTVGKEGDKKLSNITRWTESERKDLLAFLFTLNDTSFVRNPAYQEDRKAQ